VRKMPHLIAAVLVAIAVLAASISSFGSSSAPLSPTLSAPVPRAHCGPGDRPELGIQGRVSLTDRTSGRSRSGYSCNLRMLGRFQGEGSSWVSQSYKHCAYMSTHFPSLAQHPGVQVLDVSNPRAPRRVGTLTDQAMLGTWETLKVNRARGLLAAVSAPSPGGNGVGFFAVYDVKTNCARPRLLSSIASTQSTQVANGVGHEGNWTPDGRTYWATSLSAGLVTAIDVKDPSQPRIIFEGQTSFGNHGLSLSRDGTRLYIAKVGAGTGAPLDGNGVQVFDVSQIQMRVPNPQMRPIGEATWTDGSLGQHAIPVSYRGHPHLVYVDEGGAGAARILDVANETRPVVVSKLKLAIHMPKYADLRMRDTANNGGFGYEGHYCAVDRLTDPQALACGYFQSGVRVFDIRRPRYPREIAYFNPPAQLGKNAMLQGSEHANSPMLSGRDLNTDWCSSPPRFVGRQLWVACQDNGFMTLQFTHGVYPFTSTQVSSP